MHSELVENINKLLLKCDYDRIENLFQDFLEKKPENQEAWLSFGIYYIEYPIYDADAAIQCFNRVLKLDPTNIDALILKAYAQSKFQAGFDSELQKKLLSQITTANDTYKAYVYLILADNCNDDNEAIEYGLLSIKYRPDFVFNHFHLGLFYKKIKKYLNAKKTIKEGLKNIRKIAGSSEEVLDTYLIYTPAIYYADNIEGSVLSHALYCDMLNEFEQLSHISLMIAVPSLYDEIQLLLKRLMREDSLEQIDLLRVVRKCNCDKSSCLSLYVEVPQYEVSKDKKIHLQPQILQLKPENGSIALHTNPNGEIYYIEILDRPDYKEAIYSL